MLAPFLILLAFVGLVALFTDLVPTARSVPPYTARPRPDIGERPSATAAASSPPRAAYVQRPVVVAPPLMVVEPVYVDPLFPPLIDMGYVQVGADLCADTWDPGYDPCSDYPPDAPDSGGYDSGSTSSGSTSSGSSSSGGGSN